MKNIVYKNHENEINELINLLIDRKVQIITYNSHEGYGNTAFIQRVMYLLHVTKKYQLLHAELSPTIENPIREVIKKIVSKKGDLYQQLQLFSDEQTYCQDVPLLLCSLIKDVTQSETIASLLTPPEALPIYAGFYQDRLKNIFFDLVHAITEQQHIIFFIDNIQYMDNDSYYELQAVLQNPKIILVLFKTGDGIFCNKFYDEINYKFPQIELNFPEPDIYYVQKLATLYNKKLSEFEAASILSANHKNVRKILCDLRKPEKTASNPMAEEQIIKISIAYRDYIDADILLKIFSFTPYYGVLTREDILISLENIENKGLLQSVISWETRKKQYKILENIHVSLDEADKLIIGKALSDYYDQSPEISFEHMCHAWEINFYLKYNKRKNDFSKKILISALKMGYKVPEKIVQDAKLQDEATLQTLCATFLFCNANYMQAKSLLENIVQQKEHRSLDVMYAISLNRCRFHKEAEQRLSELIKTSTNIDEKTLLVSFLISNHVHSRKNFAACELYDKYSAILEPSIKYPYFLRNAATVFGETKAYSLRKKAIKYFNESGDLFGYYSTIINMASYIIKNESIEYCISTLQKAFDNLHQFNASQIHLAANNLGVCYLFAKDNMNAIKYLTLCLEKAQSIMPKGYAAVNLSAIFLQGNQIDKAHNYLTNLIEDVCNSKLARLKAHFYLQYTLVEYIIGDLKQVNTYISNTLKYCAPNENPKIYKAINEIKNNVENHKAYNSTMFFHLYVPCFLEYWTINSIDVLSNDFLPG